MVLGNLLTSSSFFSLKGTEAEVQGHKLLVGAGPRAPPRARARRPAPETALSPAAAARSSAPAGCSDRHAQCSLFRDLKPFPRFFPARGTVMGGFEHLGPLSQCTKPGWTVEETTPEHLPFPLINTCLAVSQKFL